MRIRFGQVSISLQNPYCNWCKGQLEGDSGEKIQAWIQGYAWDGEALLKARDLANWLCKQLSGESNAIISLKSSLLKLNGSFALIAQTPNGLLAAVDRLRSIPLFYGSNQAGFFLSDNASLVRDLCNDTRFDDRSTREFLLTSYVTGSDTLYPNVKQIQAGEMIVVEDYHSPEVDSIRYYRFEHGEYLDKSKDQFYAMMGEVYDRIFERLVRSAQGRRIVVPLSGGLDSRSIVVTLKRLGIQDVLCFSYGPQGNWESKISREVADRLGYPWHFVPSTRRRWSEWFRSESCWIYHLYGSGLTSLAHLQDWPAIWEMRKTGILEEEDIIVPGHSADFLAGSHIPVNLIEKEEVQSQDLFDAIADKHYTLWNWRETQPDTAYFISGRIRSRLPTTRVKSLDRLVDLFELWDWQERQAKYIVNSVRVYEFWGYEWRLPLWDNDMMDFWSKVPLRWRINKKLYDSYLEDKMFPIYDVAGLYHSKTDDLTKKLSPYIRKLSNPRLGRYHIDDYVRMWARYCQLFGCSLRSPLYLLNTATLNVSVFLSNLRGNRGLFGNSRGHMAQREGTR